MNFLVTETNEISSFWYLSLITGLCLSHSAVFLSHDHPFIMALLDTVLLVKGCSFFLIFFSPPSNDVSMKTQMSQKQVSAERCRVPA